MRCGKGSYGNAAGQDFGVNRRVEAEQGRNRHFALKRRGASLCQMHRQGMLFEKDRERADVVAVFVRQKDRRKAVRVDSAGGERRAERFGVSARVNEKFCLSRNDQERIPGRAGIEGIDMDIVHEKRLRSGKRNRITVSIRRVKRIGRRM